MFKTIAQGSVVHRRRHEKAQELAPGAIKVWSRPTTNLYTIRNVDTNFNSPVGHLLHCTSVAVLLAGPLWQLPGLPVGTADSQVHMHRSAAVYRAFEDGVFWPRWFPSVYNGLGSPTFQHYSPGLFWLVAAVHWTGIKLDQALKLVMTAAFILSGFGVYAWLRYAFGPEASLTGAALYLFHPRIWSREFFSPGPFGGAYPQLLALLLLPVCLWAITALHRQGRLRDWIVACVSLTALVYCHNLTAMIGACVLFLYWLLLAAGYRKTGRPFSLRSCRTAGSAIVSSFLAAGTGRPFVYSGRQSAGGLFPFQQSLSGMAAAFQFSISCSGQSGWQSSGANRHFWG